LRAADPVPLFEAGSFRALELAAKDVAALQRFFEENPEYFFAVGDEPPRPDEACQEFDFMPPADYPFERKWLIGFLDGSGAMIGMAGGLSNLFSEGVWHIGLFIVATRLHGSGAALAMHRGLEDWMRGAGARWIRLGVVEGNSRAERFWEKAGYLDVRKRHGVEMGRKVNTLRVMAKPLAGGRLEEYLTRVARDRPG
jgi:RimJ/RimL family protein N-acetyltransferase